MKKGFYEGGKRVMKGGVPAKVAPWYGELSKGAQAMIGQANLLAPYGRHMKFKQEAPVELAMAA